jgi:hypothetical protein
MSITKKNMEGIIMKSLFTIIFLLILAIAMISSPVHAAQTLVVSKVKEALVLDGSATDSAWNDAEAITVRDKSVERDVTLKAVYKGDMVFLLVQYTAPMEDRLHKPWVWDKELKAYKLGPQREDTFTFKWSMEYKEVDLSNFSDDLYTADVWYWKANRTDPVGYADDKHHILASESGKKAKELKSRSGKTRYLMRVGDAGKSAQKKQIFTEYQGDIISQYSIVNPEGSRADVHAKGKWKNGVWTIEFSRKLKTGHSDDVQFDSASGKKYLFGVSIAGLYANKIDKTAPHWYGQGRISDPLYLVFRE